ncbi:hypothetical protein PIB30_051404 [Stylosanthes scabra]|uniref:Uncharacterized protein n=1 Tax=Stylosanthes scabra TaxID=79078 RepID=A0ABU6VK71_9FABA|nr:hypothetical protein [Stylosanthes scabra]
MLSMFRGDKKNVFHETHDQGWFAIIRKGMAPAKASTSTAAGSTAGNPSQPLNNTYFDTKCQNNTGKLAAKSLICE